MILFTADYHIKLGQKNVPVDWALARYDSFFQQIHELEKDCDLHIIGGDIFDRMPTLEELRVFFSFVKNISVETIMYDGNHEATKKNKTFFTALKEVVNLINPLVTIVDESTKYDDFGILPYADLHKENSIEYFDSSKPLFTHVRGEIPPHVKPEVNLDRFNDFPVVFAGDLHGHNNTQRNIVYPGSPMTISFHRSKVETGYLLIAKDWSWIWSPFKLPQLLRKTVQNKDDMVASTYDHTIYELEGDIQSLSEVANSDILDKKVIKRSSEASLILDKEMTLLEELTEYLEFILELETNQIESIVGTFNDYAQKASVE